MRRIAVIVATAAALIVLTAAGGAQTPRPLPDRDSLFKATQDNLARAQAEQSRYAYKERRSDIHTNPFGRIGTDGTSLYEVTPGPEAGVFFRRLLEKDGGKVDDAKPEKQDRRQRPQARSGLDDVVATLDFVMDRRETRDGRDQIAVKFTAKPNARPQTREGRLAKIFMGTIWVDEEAREVSRVDAITTDDLTYGFGVIARLNEGTKVTLIRERVDEHIWLPTSIRFVGDGRAILFRKLNVDFGIDWFDYRKAR